MEKRKLSKSRRPKNKEEERLRAIYAKSRKQFTAADLQKFTEIEEGVPFEQVLTELEEMHRKNRKKRA